MSESSFETSHKPIQERPRTIVITVLLSFFVFSIHKPIQDQSRPCLCGVKSGVNG